MKIENAIIMAAGTSSRFVPLSYEKPKGLWKVKGEVLIERQIRQLQEAGIFDITVVVGYCKEQFYYLKEKYGVTIVVNEDYYRYNNTSTLMCVSDKISATYLCSSDNYFAENVFEKEVTHSYYAAVYQEGETTEWCIFTDRKGRIEKVEIGGQNAWYMMGHVCFLPEFSRQFKKILQEEYRQEKSRKELWESIYIRHLDELELYIRKYDAGVIHEFDSLEELRKFDEMYQNESGCRIMQNITQKLGCRENEINEIFPLEGGLTNKNFRFSCKGKSYVYRNPGEKTEELINRHDEKISTMLANELEIDAPLIDFDADTGVKIARYIEEAETMTMETVRKEENMAAIAEVLYRLHHCGKDTGVAFDVFAMAEKYEALIKEEEVALFEGYKEVKEIVTAIKKEQEKNRHLVPCHNDPLCANWIKGRDGMYLVDWEYAGMNEAMWDVADVAIEAGMSREEEEKFLQYYYKRELMEKEKQSFAANKIFIDFLWALWGKTRVPVEGDAMEAYALERFERLKQNLKEMGGR